MTQNRAEKKAARALAAERGIRYTEALDVVRAAKAAEAIDPTPQEDIAEDLPEQAPRVNPPHSA